MADVKNEQLPEKIRAFIAIEIPVSVKEAMAKAANELDRGWKDVSWARPESTHLTLKFLGDIESKRIDEIEAALKVSAIGTSPLALRAAGVGGFPNLKNPRVIWVGIAGNEELADLQKRIDERLGVLGFERDEKKFHPHLTLCRIKSFRDAKELGRIAEAYRGDFSVDFKVESFVLFRSVLKPKGAEYTALRRINLAK